MDNEMISAGRFSFQVGCLNKRDQGGGRERTF